jgi:hypothetical protein
VTLQADNPLEAFQWSRQPEAYAFIRSSADAFLKNCPPAADLAARMQRETGTRFHDWIDTIVFPLSNELRATLDAIGYEPEGDSVFHHPGGVFPRVGLHGKPVTTVMLKVESVVDFAAVWSLPLGAIEGEPLSVMRRARSRRRRTQSCGSSSDMDSAGTSCPRVTRRWR